VAPEPLLDSIGVALAEREIGFTDGRTSVGLGESVTLIPPESAKGLEFDAVIVVEPASIAALGEHGLRLLYIALTRAVRTLTLVHAEALPAPLREK
jgi:superfamily I DNA/RNA helicase